MEQLSLASAGTAQALAPSLLLSLAGWLFGALAVAAVLFYLLKMLAPIVLAGALEPKLLALLLDDKLLGVVAARISRPSCCPIWRPCSAFRSQPSSQSSGRRSC